MIPTCVASQLYDTAKSLETHDIIQVDTYSVNRFHFNPGTHGCNKDGHQGIFILITGYTIVRSSWLYGDLKNDTDTDITPYEMKTPVVVPAPGSVSSTSGEQTSQAVSAPEPRQSHQATIDTNLNRVDVVSCTGDCCSGVEGQVFSRSMLHTHDIPDVCDVFNECWFVEQKYLNGQTTMSPRLQRNVVYWWFATNVFGAVGLHKRIVLPTCLVAAIRNKYPNPAGLPYSDGHSPGALDFFARKCGQ